MSRMSGAARMGSNRLPMRTTMTIAIARSATVPPIHLECITEWTLALLRTTRSPRRLRDDAREIRPPQHVVERGELAGEHVAELALRALEAVLEILLDRYLLVRRLEVGAGEAVREVAELLYELRSEAHAVLSAAGGTKLDERAFDGDQLLVQFVGGSFQLIVLSEILQVDDL